ncbi:MAG TPA: vitamin K epoxide reductase family protein [Acidimicrobiales bacterium]|nr:vitamin K epoxide reductase family protein [Acidimicrobiales bacterium]
MTTDLGLSPRGAETRYRAPHWAVITTFTLSLLGLGLSIYLTITHFQPHALVCSNGGAIDCLKVTTSPQSYVLGIPVAILGLCNYTVMVGLNSPWAWRSRVRGVHVARFVLAIASMCFVLWLIYAEVEIIGAICLYCTGVHVVTFALLIVLTLVSPEQLGWSRSRAR